MRLSKVSRWSTDKSEPKTISEAIQYFIDDYGYRSRIEGDVSALEFSQHRQAQMFGELIQILHTKNVISDEAVIALLCGEYEKFNE